jgi:V-type H+-transporting ATPase subunit a
LYFDNIENIVNEDYKKVLDLISSHNDLVEQLEILKEKRCVYEKSSLLFAGAEGNSINGVDSLEEGGSIFNYLAGTINANDEIKIKKMIFRVSKGRAVITFFDYINFDNDGLMKTKSKSATPVINKKIYTIFFPSGAQRVLFGKIINICDVFGASRYQIPSRDNIMDALSGINSEILEKRSVKTIFENTIHDSLKEKIEGNSSKLELYRLYFRKERMIYQNMAKCISSDTFLDAEVWLLKNKFEKIKSLVKEIFKEDDNQLTANFIDLEESNLPKPTYIPVNEFMLSFQQIVDTYGIPRYQEINPAIFNIVTFPFLFGIMFGDIGHGLAVMIFGFYLCIMQKKIEANSFLVKAVPYRYLIVMLGFFGFYCGLLYNDFMAIPLPIFKSCYDEDGSRETDCVYPIGIDHKWYEARNDLAFMNSFKMKFSVIIGVIHMIGGITLKGINYIHFKNKLGFFFEFIPQLLFMSLLFGYMNVMIFIKWSTDWTGIEDKAPSLITQLMNIYLKVGSVVYK